MTGLLASVANLAEARLAATVGADIIDLKNPAAGALGALPVGDVARIAEALGAETRVSATIGDLPMTPRVVVPAVEAMAASGVDYVKIGFFPGGDWAAVLRELRPLTAKGIRLVAVLFGDLAPDLGWLTELAGAGFAGAMLDTADKSKGSLCAVAEPGFLHEFVTTARDLTLLSGLAGSLRREDIPQLLGLKPDYLGFRTALCGGNRTGHLDVEKLRIIRDSLTAGNAQYPFHP